MKKCILTLILAMFMLFALTACGGEAVEAPAEEEPAVEEVAEPAVEEEPEETASSVYTYSENNQFGLAIDWTLELKDDGTYVLSEENEFVGFMSYEGTSWTADGDTVTCGAMLNEPGLYEWANPAGFTVTLDGTTFTPVVSDEASGEPSDEMSDESAAEEEPEETASSVYTYSENNQFGLAIDWTLELRDDGTYVLSEENEFVGFMSYEGTSWTADDDTVTCGAMLNEPGMYEWANPAGFTVTIADGGFTPVVEE